MSDNQLQNRAENLVARAQAILTKPTETWARIARETDAPAKVFTGYVLPLAAIGPIASFIGGQLFPISFMGVTVKTPLIAGLVGAVLGFVFAMIAFWIIAMIANVFSKQFDGRDDFPAAFRLAAYSFTAAWIAGILGIIPMLGILAILGGLYSLFLFYKGATPVMGVPEDKSILYTAVVVIVAIVVNIVMGLIVGAITATMMLGAAATTLGSAVDPANVDIDSPYGSVQVTEDGGTTKMTIEADGETMTVEVPTEEE
jgi:hypothetical protein